MDVICEPPKDWKDLELTVAKILNECGFDAERGKQILTVRGTVDIDVFAKDNSSIPPSEYLIDSTSRFSL